MIANNTFAWITGVSRPPACAAALNSTHRKQVPAKACNLATDVT
ncbi:hypothetical protein PF005_g25556 [Phytophthora fragariae]|uniref:Uncharacterized protein n=1 Tax=Phytophthora fragariae TaxID=53985 RepID=A0A6A3HT87_9STRA|nr:hypothetical protein PF011_g25063 [Phytophthora fragariae]KAE9091445.1 hypothetical protein PF006_g24927 [Phytophthora fragariae]KAE9175086.1 hypothetical protein PF005_g25556 [Phytophthora fragariae]KAE9182153.1 hypothetical protein PF004_g24323 [Phytophthora fragariae]KAE9184794.1 hypothetical protein PF002_g26337 [Phytophthora fragariae]